MKNKYTAAFYRERGARAYEIGILRIPVFSSRGWQQSAEREGYADARAKWKAANPNSDEWAAAHERAQKSARQAIGE